MSGFDKIGTRSSKVGGADYFPTQKAPDRSPSTISDNDRKYGAPLGPIPRSFLRIPRDLAICNPLASAEELEVAKRCRQPFLIDGYGTPYMHDVVRAFRTIRGKRTYIEVGTFDRGNLAYASDLLADDALLIGIDLQAEETRDAKLRQTLKPSQRYLSIVGDSRTPETIASVKAALGDRPLDAIFVDGGHTAHAVMCDYVNYGEMVYPGGVIMFHDSLWEGTSVYKGCADALAEIDKLDPIYLVDGKTPCHRFMRTLWRDEMWGIVGVHLPG